jgi:hypothetical protein
MVLTSPVFLENTQIPPEYAHKSGNVSPPLNISGVPKEAESLCLIVHDPDAPIGDYTHWLVWNIDPGTEVIERGKVPEGSIQGKNDSGINRWVGPAPPSGTHHYQFELYALDKPLNLKEDAARQQLEEEITGCVIDKATLTGLFSA